MQAIEVESVIKANNGGHLEVHNSFILGHTPLNIILNKYSHSLNILNKYPILLKIMGALGSA